MELQLLNDSPLNTVLIADGAPLYSIESTGFLNSKTEIRRAHKEMDIEKTSPVAVIEWGGLFSKTMVTLGGQTRAWDEILSPTGGWFSHSRTMVSPSGTTLRWNLDCGGHLSLLNSDSITITDYSRSKWGIFSPSRKAFINVSQESIPMLDLVIVTWVIMEEKRRERERRRRRAAGSGGGP